MQALRGLIEPSHSELSIVHQCKLISLHRSNYYFRPAEENPENLAVMRLIDEEYLRRPFYGSLKLISYLKEMAEI